MVQGTKLMNLEEYITATYYEEGGLLLRKFTYKQWKAGMESGVVGKRGYKTVSILGSRYYTHRILYWIYYGYWPDLVDHKDMDKLNNLKSNLRELTKSENGLNVINSHRDSESGHLGILLRKDTGRFSVRFRGASKGCYKTIEEAKHVYDICRDAEPI